MTTYLLNDIYPTIQGEGCHTGVPMVLVRLHGCPVGCPFCDTKETWGSDEDIQVDHIGEALGANAKFVKVTGSNIASYARACAPVVKWIMLTGGEPAEQTLDELILQFHEQGFKVALETSGTAIGHIHSAADWVCVSPKINMPGKRVIRREAIASADEIKMVIGKQTDLEKLYTLLDTFETKQDVQICLQPMSAGKRATDLCMRTCLEKGWRLSIQTHKLVNIR